MTLCCPFQANHSWSHCLSLFAMHPASLLSLVLSRILTAVPKVLKSSFLDFVLFPYRESSQPDWSELLKQFYCKLKKTWPRCKNEGLMTSENTNTTDFLTPSGKWLLQSRHKKTSLFYICWNVFLSYYSGMSIRRCVFCICWQIYKYTNNSSWQVYDNRLLHDAVKRNIQ